MSIAISSLFSVASIVALFIGKFEDIYVMGLFIAPVIIYAWIAWLSKESTERIRDILYEHSNQSRR
jgi:hypothetical protein